MYIYKFTHIETGRSYIGQTRRKAEGRDTFVKTKKTSGWTWSEEQKAKLKLLDKSHCKGRTWKLIDGVRVWFDKEASV